MQDKEEFLGLERVLQVRFQWSAGPYLGKLLTELKDNGKLWAARCPGCERILLPPRIVCAECYTRVPEYPDGWFPLSGRGTLVSWERVVYPQMDPETGQIRQEPYLHGSFMLEEGILYVHYLGPEDLDENQLREGMRVEMVMKPPEEREGKPTDIQYFRVLEE
jgi:uncharacterized OB-fold protein